MATRQMYPSKSHTSSRSFTRALALAFNEWLLMLMLFVNSVFSYVITRFADYSELRSPCLMCSRLDHILGTHSKKSHWDKICSKHKSEISSLVYCHAHCKLVDVRGMCETCLFSFATMNKSNAETYRLLVGKLGEDSSCFESKSDRSTNPRYCTCCNQLWMPQTSTSPVAKPETLPNIRLVSSVRTGKQSTPKKSVSFNHLPHVGYSELKIHSDTESEAVFSEDEGVFVKEKDHMFQTVDLETPPAAITLPYDMVTDKLLSLDQHLQPLVDKVELQEIDLRTDSLFPELSQVKGVLETSEKVLKEEEIISLDNLFVTSRAMEHSAAVKDDLIQLQDTCLRPDFKEVPADALMEETELICLNDVDETPEDVLKGIELMTLHDTSLGEVPESFTTNEVSSETSKEIYTRKDDIMEETELICLNDAPETPEDVLKGIELMSLHDTSLDEVPESFTANETSVETSKESHTNKADVTSLESQDIVVSSPKSTPENLTENRVLEKKEMEETSLTVSSVSEMAPQAAVTSQTEPVTESESSSFNSMSVAAETNLGSVESWMQKGELIDLADAYNVIVHNEGNKESNGGGGEMEKWMKKDTSRVSEDLKALLTQISASRGIEFLSPRDISPKISSDQEIKNMDLDMQLILQKRMLERNESNLSLEGVSVSEIEGESESDRLKRQVEYDRKLLAGLYKELEEERSASAVATNQAMAMITRLQEEKASFQMEALQNLRMMEEQAEYDMEAIQKLNDLLVEKEKLIQDLEAEIDYFREQTPQKKYKLDAEENMNNKIQNCLNGFNEERQYITSCLEKIENRGQADANGEAHVDNLATEESVSELHESVERLKGDLYFLETVVNSLGQGNEGVEFVKEIASHLQTLRNLSMKRRQDHTDDVL